MSEAFLSDAFIDDWTCRRAGMVEELLSTGGPARLLAALESFQAGALVQTLAHARDCCRFYGSRLSGKRINRIRSIQDLADLPFTLPRDIREDAAGFVCLSQDRVARVFTLESSGTTAPAKRLFFTQEDLALTVDFFAACLEPLMAPEERGMIFLPGTTPFSAGDLIRRAMEKIGARPRVHGLITDGRAAVREMLENRPGVIIGMPVQILALGEMMARGAEKMPAISRAILTADYVSPAVVRRIESLFNCTTLSHYGLTETGFGMAIQCPAGEGLHIRHPHMIVEIVDPGSGAPLPRGEWGEIVITTLGRRAMPLIRYRTGDLSRILDRPCGCGSCFPRLDRIRNRQADGVDLGEGLVLTMADLDDLLFGLDGVVDFRAGITGDRARPVLDLKVEILAPVRADILADCLLSGGPVKKAVDRGRLSLGNMEMRPCTFNPSYVGKRLVRDLRNRDRRNEDLQGRDRN